MSFSRNPRQYRGVRAILPPDLQYATRNPASSDRAYVKGTLWLNTTDATAFMWPGSGDWIALGSGTTGAVVTLTGDTGGALSPTAGNINILGGSGVTVTGSGSTLTVALTGGGVAIDSFVPDAGTNPVVPSALGVITMAGTASQITTTGGLNSLTFSIPSAFIAPGSIVATTTVASTTTMTAGTGLTVTTGNATVSAGNIVATLGNITASAGNIAATLGSVAAGTAVTAGTSITATLGNITATNGNVVLGTAGNKIISTSVAATTTAGANSFGTVTLVGGAAIVSTTAALTASMIQLTIQSLGTVAVPMAVGVTARTNGVSFTITSSDATDTSVIAWMIIN